MKNDYTTNSHCLTYTFLFKRLGECHFLILGMKVLRCRFLPEVAHCAGSHTSHTFEFSSSRRHSWHSAPKSSQNHSRILPSVIATPSAFPSIFGNWSAGQTGESPDTRARNRRSSSYRGELANLLFFSRDILTRGSNCGMEGLQG